MGCRGGRGPSPWSPVAKQVVDDGGARGRWWWGGVSWRKVCGGVGFEGGSGGQPWEEGWIFLFARLAYVGWLLGRGVSRIRN